jgi:iron(III) transport system ATP-binding protein
MGRNTGDNGGSTGRIFLMRQGRLIQAGTPEELYRKPADAAAARFFSDTNELQGRLAGGGVETPLGVFPCPASLTGPQALVLIRPQGLKRAEGSIGAEGLVTETRFQGDDVKCSVLFKGLEEPLTALVDARSAPARGSACRFAIDPEHVFVFESASSHPIS